MRFDDRLLTVLNQPASDRHDAAVRWRQLVDLVARAGPNSASPVVAQAIESIRAEAANVDERLRAAAARAVAALPLPLSLLECFAADRLSVSAPVLAAATLDPAQWRVLLQGVDDETRRFVLTLHPELAADEADLTDRLVEPQGPLPEPPPGEVETPPATMSSSLSEVVARIERRRRIRASQQPQSAGSAPIAPAGAPSLFRWECGPSGEIAWVDGAPRGALIGRSIARSQESEESLDPDVVRAFAMRAPFRDGAMSLGGDGLVSGEWRISGVPAFDPADGRFAGYRGIALRQAPASQETPAGDVLTDPDSLRELVHEIKTPLNAIIGFAEIIEGQYLGPADRPYRERAGEIVGQAHLLLAAIDDLDFAAKTHSQRREDGNPRVDLAELLDRATPSLRSLASERGVELEIAPQHGAVARVQPELADRLVFRLTSAVIAGAQSGERLRVALDQAANQVRLSVSRPAVLRGMSDRQLFDAEAADEKLSMMAFSCRLIRGLARIAGGDLVTSPAGLILAFPLA